MVVIRSFLRSRVQRPKAPQMFVYGCDLEVALRHSRDDFCRLRVDQISRLRIQRH